MPISIDGSGTIGGLSTGGLPDGSVNNADLAANAVSTSKILDGAVTTAKMGSNEQSGLAKAWVNFNGTTVTPSTIRASYNVSSITRSSAGTYTVNLIAGAVTDANFAAVATTQAMGYLSPTITYNAATTTTCSFYVQGTNAGSGVYADAGTVCVTFFR